MRLIQFAKVCAVLVGLGLLFVVGFIVLRVFVLVPKSEAPIPDSSLTPCECTRVRDCPVAESCPPCAACPTVSCPACPIPHCPTCPTCPSCPICETCASCPPCETASPEPRETMFQCMSRLKGHAKEWEDKREQIDFVGLYSDNVSRSDTSLEGAFREKYSQTDWSQYSDKVSGSGVLYTSGAGSRLDTTIDIRCFLSTLRDLVGMTVLVDAACGDMHWMHWWLEEGQNRGVKYIGLDVVPELIQYHNEHFFENGEELGRTRDRVEFWHADMTVENALQTIRENSSIWSQVTEDDVVVVMARHVLFHLPEPFQRRALWNLQHSGADVLLLTSGFFDASQLIVQTAGDWLGSTDFTRVPYHLPKPKMILKETHYMGLWTLPFKIEKGHPASWLIGEWSNLSTQ